MNKREGAPQGYHAGEANGDRRAAISRRIITGTELAARQAASPLWQHAKFLIEWKDGAGRVHTAGNYRITRGRPDGTTETVRYLDTPDLRDVYAEQFRGQTLLRQVHGGASIPVDVYQLTIKGNRKRRRSAFDSFVETAREDGYRIRGCEIDLHSETSERENVTSAVTFFVESRQR